MIPKIFCKHGTKTPIMVPNLGPLCCPKNKSKLLSDNRYITSTIS